MEVKRGEMYMANLSPVIGSEQGGEHPVLILQNDKANQFSPTTVITAVTSKIEKNRIYRHISDCTQRTCQPIPWHFWSSFRPLINSGSETISVY